MPQSGSAGRTRYTVPRGLVSPSGCLYRHGTARQCGKTSSSETVVLDRATGEDCTSICVLATGATCSSEANVRVMHSRCSTGSMRTSPAGRMTRQLDRHQASIRRVQRRRWRCEGYVRPIPFARTSHARPLSSTAGARDADVPEPGGGERTQRRGAEATDRRPDPGSSPPRGTSRRESPLTAGRGRA
jgi:hypothetical protein